MNTSTTSKDVRELYFVSRYLANIYLFKITSGNRKRCEICSKWRYWRRSGAFIVNFEYI